MDRTFPVARVSSLLDREDRRMRADPPEPLAVLKSLDREQDDIHRAARTAAVSLGDLVVNRPGFDGDSGYWFPTPVGAAGWAA